MLSLADGFRTNTGRLLAAQRHQAGSYFYQGMLNEVSLWQPRWITATGTKWRNASMVHSEIGPVKQGSRQFGIILRNYLQHEIHDGKPFGCLALCPALWVSRARKSV
jgi:hypothetical protein